LYCGSIYETESALKINWSEKTGKDKQERVMSRSGYVEYECDEQRRYAQWRAAVSSATRGKRGQAFFKELLKALDEMPVKELIAEKLECNGQFCALGTVGKSRGLDMSGIAVDDQCAVAQKFDIAHSLACEIMYMNDEQVSPESETDSQRWERVRKWVADQIKTGANDG
jgi:hypothetical protein